MIFIIFGSIGSGKSTISELLAKTLGYEYLEVDELSLLKTGYKSVAEALKMSPTKLAESQLLVSKELSTKDNLVLAYGGGAVLNRLNFEYFKENCPNYKSIYLRVELEEQLSRIITKNPELKNQLEKVKQNLQLMNQERDAISNAIADFVIDTTKLKTEETLALILEKIG